MASAPRRIRGLGVVAILVLATLTLCVGFWVYAELMLHWAYSDGERAGILQKLSRKGWVCKTIEGELAMSTVPGVMPIIWNFTVRDPAVAKQIQEALGRRVVLHYREHRGVPTTCFGETTYFVDGVHVAE